MKIRTIVFLTIMLISLSACNKTTPKADYGVVPLPKEIKNNDGQFILNEKTIISYQSSKPELVNEANHLKNYVEDITGFELNIIDNEDIVSNAINLSLREGFTDNEAYRITVTPQAVAIEASDAEAAFHAIQTIRKSLPVGYEKQDIALPCGEIYDYPRFGYRGLHVDVSRHFFPIDSIKEIIDIMALHNLNKFHFHLTDDQGWRIEIDKYPKLTEIGSMRSGTKIGKTDKFDTIPHGGFYTKEELAGLAAVLAKHPQVYVIADEIYEHINFTGSFTSIAEFESVRDRTIIVNGVSKAYAMTGWRIGFIAAPLWVAKATTKLQGQYTSNPSSIAQKAAEAAYTGPQECVEEMRKAFERRRDLVTSLLKEIPGLKINHPEGAFYIFPEVSAYFGKSYGNRVINDANDVAMYLLEEAHVATVNGDAFCAPGYIRLSYATSDDNIREACRRIAEALAKLK